MLYNYSDNFKIAKVIPVLKKNSSLNLSNYRPISLLPYNQIFEKLICKRLTNFLENNSILFDNQFGFRSKHSTTHAVLTIVDRIQQAIEVSCGLFLDVSKAFDTMQFIMTMSGHDNKVK